MRSQPESSQTHVCETLFFAAVFTKPSWHLTETDSPLATVVMGFPKNSAPEVSIEESHDDTTVELVVFSSVVVLLVVVDVVVEVVVEVVVVVVDVVEVVEVVVVVVDVVEVVVVDVVV